MLTVSISAEDKCRIPIVIGVCGHRDLATPETVLQERLGAVWEILRKKFPHTPFLVLNSLAEGADRMVLKYLPEDIPYIAVLPFAPEDFKADFTSEESRREFEGYLQRAARVVIAGDTVGDYSPAANYVLKHSDLMLALWEQDEKAFDEQNAKSAPGGTLDSVYGALTGERTILPDERCVIDVLHIPVRRKNSSPDIPASPEPGMRVVASGKAEVPMVLAPEKWQPHDDLRLMECFNRVRLKYDPEADRMARFANRPDVERDAARFAFFDRLSLVAQKRQKREFAWFFAFAVLLAIVMVLNKSFDWWPWANQFPLAPPSIFVCAMWVYFRVLRPFSAMVRIDPLALHADIYTQSRSIAEALRVKIFWKLWGLREPLEENLPQNVSAMVRIFRNWDLWDGEAAAAEAPQEKAVLNGWIAEQSRWFRRKAKICRRKERWARRLQWGMLSTAVAFAAIGYLCTKKFNESALFLVMGVVIFSCIAYLRQKKAWNDLAASYKDFQRNFDYFLRNYAAFSPEERTLVIRKLGVRALRENSVWRRLRSWARR